ncbi:unnamed protein product, partial [Sphacelaria rigidula]
MTGGEPWCRWVVRTVGFVPPRGRPGKAQLAGLSPGDELTRLGWIQMPTSTGASTSTQSGAVDWAATDACVIGRELMRRTLFSLSERPKNGAGAGGYSGGGGGGDCGNRRSTGRASGLVSRGTASTMGGCFLQGGHCEEGSGIDGDRFGDDNKDPGD